jgi:hypothetical protein
MVRSGIIAAIALVQVAASTAAQPGPLPGGALGPFLQAADRNNFSVMQSLMVRGGPAFVQRIRGCYLRAVYRSKTNGEIVGAWMCAEGPNASRVLLGDLKARGGKVLVTVTHEERNQRPAPPRNKSAFR